MYKVLQQKLWQPPCAVAKLLLVMKITTFIMITVILQVSATTFAQKISLSERNAALTSILDRISTLTGYDFAYKSENLSRIKNINIQVKNVELKEVLDQLLIPQNLEYTVENKSVIISKKEPSFLDNLIARFTAIDARGRILDDKGSPLDGATVTVKGTNRTTKTNVKGEFMIPDVPDDAVLVISYVGYKDLEITVKNAVMPLEIKLNIATGELEEVKITYSTGYQQLKLSEVTGSVAVIDKGLLNRRVSPNILSRLEGVASGVLFDKQAENNFGISVRGRSTIYANTQPLVIIDNLPFQGNLNDINPNDVESISVLKDAAAASLWGVLSGNGVIVITTRRGKNNQPVKLNFNSNVTLKEKPDLFYDPQFMNPSDFIDLEIGLFKKGWYNGDLALPSTPISPVVGILNKRKHGLISVTDSASQIDALRKYDIRNDYSKYFYRPSVLQQHHLNLSGGNDNSNYYFSAGYDKDLQSINYNSSNRFTLNSQMTFTPIRNLEFTGGLTLSLANSVINGISSIRSTGKNQNIYPYARLADDERNALPIINNFSTTFVNGLSVNGLLDWSYIPLDEHNYKNQTAKNTNNRINASVKYAIVPALDVQVSYLRQSTNDKSESVNEQEAFSTRNLINQFSIVSGGNVTARNVPLGAIVGNTAAETLSNSGRAQLNYNQSFSVHNISGMAGVDIIDTKATSFQSTVYGYDINTGSSIPVNFQQRYPTYPFGAQSTIFGAPAISPYTQDRFRSYFANLGYSFNEKYFLTFNGKIDQSNLFGVKTNQKSVPLWATGARWNISKESFYHMSWLPQLSFRASYGFSGNYDKSISAMSIIEYTPDNINGQPFAVIASAGNPQLRWEKIGILNIALEFQTKNAAISGSMEYYQKKGVDMIGNSALPSSSGFYALKGNYSNMKAGGFDFILNTQNLKGEVTWSSNLLLSHAVNKVTKNEGKNLQLVGRPVQGIYTYRWGGLDPLNGDPLGYIADTLSKKYIEINREASADPTKYIYSGSASPRYFGAIRNTITWKGLSISANLTFKAGYYFLKNSISYTNLINTGLAHKDYENRWKVSGDEAFTNIPSFNFPANADRDNFYQRSEINVEKGDHIRFQDINVSYTVVNSNQRLPFSSIKVYFYANNLGILWKENDQGLDPDFIGGYRNPKTYSIGLNVSF